jgi:hypothetical protein
MIVASVIIIGSCIGGFMHFLGTDDWELSIVAAFVTACVIILFFAFFTIIRNTAIDWDMLLAFLKRMDTIVIWGK